MNFRSLRLLSVAVVVLILCVAAQGQSHETNVFSVKLGDKVIVLPAEKGFEEATSQFEAIKARFTTTEAAENDMLAGFLSSSDCELVRRGEKPLMVQYAKISVLRQAREQAMSKPTMDAIVQEFRKNGATLMDPDGPRMKALLKKIDEGLTRLDSKETKVEMTQPQNLGEFDIRPNVYGVMLLINLQYQQEGNATTIPVLAAMTYMLVKERVIFVYAYRRYSSSADVVTLKDFSIKWNTSILAAN